MKSKRSQKDIRVASDDGLGVAVYSSDDLKKWWPAICYKCGWTGLSRDCHGGNPIADSGDYDDAACPECDAIVEEDTEAEATPNRDS